MESYNEDTQRAKLVAGLKGDGPFFKNPNLAPKMRFVDGYPRELAEKFGCGHKGEGSAVSGKNWMQRQGKY